MQPPQSSASHRAHPGIRSPSRRAPSTGSRHPSAPSPAIPSARRSHGLRCLEKQRGNHHHAREKVVDHQERHCRLQVDVWGVPRPARSGGSIQGTTRMRQPGRHPPTKGPRLGNVLVSPTRHLGSPYSSRTNARVHQLSTPPRSAAWMASTAASLPAPLLPEVGRRAGEGLRSPQPQLLLLRGLLGAPQFGVVLDVGRFDIDHGEASL